jgi:DNA-directed RNA polymerase specialized sigma24 family protein
VAKSSSQSTEGRFEEREALEGLSLASIETTGEEYGIQAYIEDHFEAFERFAEKLSPFDRQILTEYYHLGKTQEQLAVVHGISQPTVVRSIQAAAEAFGHVIAGCKPMPSQRRPLAPLNLREPLIIGQFTIDLTSKGLNHLFSPHATPRCS